MKKNYIKIIQSVVILLLVLLNFSNGYSQPINSDSIHGTINVNINGYLEAISFDVLHDASGNTSGSSTIIQASPLFWFVVLVVVFVLCDAKEAHRFASMSDHSSMLDHSGGNLNANLSYDFGIGGSMQGSYTMHRIDNTHIEITNTNFIANVDSAFASDFNGKMSETEIIPSAPAGGAIGSGQIVFQTLAGQNRTASFASQYFFTGNPTGIHTEQLSITSTIDATLGGTTIGSTTTFIGTCATITSIATPTLTQWGLILFTLLLLASGMVFVQRRQHTLVMAEDVTQQAKFDLFNRTLFFKVLGIVLLLAVSGLTVAFWYFGKLSQVDSLGTLVSATIVAYMAHLWLLRKNK